VSRGTPLRPRRGLVEIRRAGAFDLALLAGLHAACFEERWDESALASLLAMPGALAFLAAAEAGPLGFVILRTAAEEAEIISIGVSPEARRSGVGRRLLGAAAAAARDNGAAQIFLEVAADNFQALALYSSDGFTEVGRRSNYYRRIGGATTALVLSKKILPRGD
jgi:[ribosomal protein S18]-alanine N-acetyltransferase